jgi:hypothetical protein
MSLLNDPTIEQQTVALLKDAVVGTLNFLKNSFDNAQRLVWQNGSLSPQEVFDALGTDAGELVALSAALAAFINSVAPENKQVASLKPADVTLTVNEDGTVTLS